MLQSSSLSVISLTGWTMMRKQMKCWSDSARRIS